jgi:hypothetical protein
VEFSAQCHCGVLTARYSTQKPPGEWPIRACQCSFCRAHGALSTSDPMGRLRFGCSRPELLQRYRFATGTAEFSAVSRVRRVPGCTAVERRRKIRYLEHSDTQPGSCRSAQPGSDELWRRDGRIATRAARRSVDAAGKGQHLRGLPQCWLVPSQRL